MRTTSYRESLDTNSNFHELSSNEIKRKLRKSKTNTDKFQKGEIFCFTNEVGESYEYRYIGYNRFQKQEVGSTYFIKTDHLSAPYYLWSPQVNDFKETKTLIVKKRTKKDPSQNDDTKKRKDDDINKIISTNSTLILIIDGERCKVTFEKNGNIKWENNSGKKGRFGNTKGVRPIEGFEKMLKNQGIELYMYESENSGQKTIVKQNGVYFSQKGSSLHVYDESRLVRLFNIGDHTAEEGVNESNIQLPALWNTQLPALIEETRNDITKNIDSKEEITPPEEKNDTPRIGMPNPFVYSTVNISNLQNHLYEVAKQRAEERLRTEREKKSFFGKGMMFFTRKNTLEKYIQEEMGQLRSESMFEASTETLRSFASARNTTESQLHSRISPSETFQYDEIDALATQYIHSQISHEKFIEIFETIIAEKGDFNDISEKGSNILIELDPKRHLHKALKSRNPQIIGEVLKNPDAMVYFASLFGAPYSSRLLEDLLQKEDLLQQLSEIQIILQLEKYSDTNTSALSVQDNQRVSGKSYNSGKWFQKHPVLKMGGIWAANVALNVGLPGIGSIISTAVGASLIGGSNGVRRYAEYTDEQRSAEERIAGGAGSISEQIREIETRISQESDEKKKKKLQRQSRKLTKEEKRFGKTRNTEGMKNKEGEDISAKEGTIQHHFISLERLNARLEKIIRGEGLSKDTEKQQTFARAYLAQAVARLDIYDFTGHLFFRRSRQVDYSDKGYNEQELAKLQKNILSTSTILNFPIGPTTLNQETKNPEASVRESKMYSDIIEKLSNDLGYADKRFEDVRRQTSAKVGLLTTGLYGASAAGTYWATSTLSSWWTSGTEMITDPSTTITTPGAIVIDPAIQAQLQATLGSHYTDFVTNLQTAHNPQTLWDTLTRDIFHNTTLGNDAKNEIMTYILNATDIQNGVTRPELLIEAINQGIITDITHNLSRINEVVSKLHEWGYRDVTRNWLTQTIIGLDNGTILTSSLSLSEQTRVSEALWCYVHRNGLNSTRPMFEVFMDRLPDSITTIPGETREVIREGIGTRIVIPIPTWRNMFLSGLPQSERATSDQETLQRNAA